MKRIIKPLAYCLFIFITTLTLTSGISKRDYGGYKNLLDEMYYQAVKQNDNLQTIEDDMERFYKKKDEALEKYNSFLAYNNRYYSDARSEAATIIDAAEKQKANDLINSSELKYRAKLSDWETVKSELYNRERELKDLYARLKITVTIPMIEKYQTGLPDNAKLKEANGDLQKLIEKIKAIVR